MDLIGDGKRCEDICKHAPPQKGKWPCEDCDMRYHDRAEKQTNADKIRSMSDKELARFLYIKTCEDGYPQFDNIPRWLDWLKQECADEST